MISHYALYTTSELTDHYELTGGLPKGVKPHYNISPTVNAPIIINDAGVRAIKLMKWGLLALGAKDTNSIFRYKTYNIPSEKIFSRHSWEQAVRERRCLVPANGFYELNESGKKQAFYVQPGDNEMVTFAGVYNSWVDPDGTTQGTFSIITLEASSDMPDSSSRMPVIISRENQARWLDPTITDMGSMYDMLRPHPLGYLTVYQVNAGVHSPKPNKPEMIVRV